MKKKSHLVESSREEDRTKPPQIKKRQPQEGFFEKNSSNEDEVGLKLSH